MHKEHSYTIVDAAERNHNAAKMIENTFKKYGDTFTCVSLSGDYRIYKRVSPNGVLVYEVIKPVMQGGILRYPGSSLWGIYGWTCLNEKAVVEKINKLQNNKTTNNKQQ